VDEHKSAACDVAGTWQRYSKRKAGRNGRINRIAAFF
jgi:hypothetical protein